MTAKRKGFTLIEILLVVAAIAILAGIIIIAINPAKQLGDTRNAQRWTDINTILNATYQYYIDNGALPATILMTEMPICKTGISCAGGVDLSVITNSEKYITSIPFDPLTGTSTNQTGYTIYKDWYNRLVVKAPDAENGVVISGIR